MPKPKIGIYWCASCGGCEEAVVDLEEQILKVVDAVDIVLWPVAMDFKRKDIEAMPDQSIAVAFINGAVRMSEQEEWVHMLRRKALTASSSAGATRATVTTRKATTKPCAGSGCSSAC